MPPHPTLFANVSYEQPRSLQDSSSYHEPQDEPQTPGDTLVVSKLVRIAELQIKSNDFKPRSIKVFTQPRYAKDFCDVTCSGPQDEPNPTGRATALRALPSPSLHLPTRTKPDKPPHLPSTHPQHPVSLEPPLCQFPPRADHQPPEQAQWLSSNLSLPPFRTRKNRDTYRMVWEVEDPAAIKFKMPIVAPQVKVRPTVKVGAPSIVKVKVPRPTRPSSCCCTHDGDQYPCCRQDQCFNPLATSEIEVKVRLPPGSWPRCSPPH